MLTEVVSKIKDEIEPLNTYHVVMAGDSMHIYRKDVFGSYIKMLAIIHIILVPDQMQLFVQAFMRKSKHINDGADASFKLTKIYINMDDPHMLDKLSNMIRETNITVSKYAETGEL